MPVRSDCLCSLSSSYMELTVKITNYLPRVMKIPYALTCKIKGCTIGAPLQKRSAQDFI